jgi:hypothetical protein
MSPEAEVEGLEKELTGIIFLSGKSLRGNCRHQPPGR